MINLAKQGFVNPFLSAIGASFQPGVLSSVGRCPCCGNAVTIAGTIQPQQLGVNPVGFGATLGQQMGGFSPNPYGVAQSLGIGQPNPLAFQAGIGQQNPLAFQTGIGQQNPFGFQGGIANPQGINPFTSQFTPNWPVSQVSQTGMGGRTGAYGVDPRMGIGSQLGYTDPNLMAGLNPGLTADPISSWLLQQQANQLAQQQLPIRSLFGGQQGIGGASLNPGFAAPINQWNDPYRAFIEAQLVSQLVQNPYHQLQRAYGLGEQFGLGVPFATGQQFHPLFS